MKNENGPVFFFMHIKVQIGYIEKYKVKHERLYSKSKTNNELYEQLHFNPNHISKAEIASQRCSSKKGAFKMLLFLCSKPKGEHP